MYSFLLPISPCCFVFFFFNDTATTEIYTLSLHDALPISSLPRGGGSSGILRVPSPCHPPSAYETMLCRIRVRITPRSEEHTSELQSRSDLVCRLLLEKKK